MDNVNNLQKTIGQAIVDNLRGYYGNKKPGTSSEKHSITYSSQEDGLRRDYRASENIYSEVLEQQVRSLL